MYRHVSSSDERLYLFNRGAHGVGFYAGPDQVELSWYFVLTVDPSQPVTDTFISGPGTAGGPTASVGIVIYMRPLVAWLEQAGTAPALNRIAPVAPAPVCNVFYEFLKLERQIAEPSTLLVKSQTQLVQPVQVVSMVDWARPSAVPSAAEIASTLLLVTLIFVCVT